MGDDKSVRIMVWFNCDGHMYVEKKKEKKKLVCLIIS